jgi:hypothetical protein
MFTWEGAVCMNFRRKEKNKPPEMATDAHAKKKENQ